MKRYTLIERTFGDGNSFMEVREDENGEFVEYKDVEQLLKTMNTIKESERNGFKIDY